MTESTLTKNQKKTFTTVVTGGDGVTFPKSAQIKTTLRFDDRGGNGHNTFSAVCEITDLSASGYAREWGGDADHATIAKHFPQLAHLLKWHLCSTDGPLHYPANVIHLAGDRDCWGHRAGEPSAFSDAVQFGVNPIKHKLRKQFAAFLRDHAPEFDLEVIRIDHDNKPGGFQHSPKFTFGGYAGKWHECPFDNELEAMDFLAALQTQSPQFLTIATQWSEGKARQLDMARSAAIWPEATDEELCAPPNELKAALEARLPGLLEAFRHDMESIGFTW